MKVLQAMNLKWVKLARMLALAMVLALVAPMVLPAASVTAEAATVKLNATKKSIYVGKSFTLKISGTKKAVTWTSSKKSVATVSKKGKVTGKSAGKAVITAKVGGKKYTCTVTVRKDDYVTNAPFDAKRMTVKNCTIVVPGKWKSSSEENDSMATVILTPTSALGVSNIVVANTYAKGSYSAGFDDYLKTLKAEMTADALKQTVKQQNGIEPDITNLKVAEEKMDCGRVAVVTYDIAMMGVAMKQKTYQLLGEDYIMTVTVTFTELDTSMTEKEIIEIADHMVDSIKWKK